MARHDRWKKVTAYVAGIIILTICLILALFFPNWYGQWQDEQLMGTVMLESRENIEFLDGDSLDIAGRMKKIGEAASLKWNFDYGYDSEESAFYTEDWIFTNIDQRENIQRCKEMVKAWWDAGLFPKDCSSWIDEEDHLLLYSERTLYVDDSVLPICFLIFTNEESMDEEAMWTDPDGSVIENETVIDEDQMDLLLILMDAEKDLIYYASLSGSVMQDAMMQELGYESEQMLMESLQNGTNDQKKPDTTSYNFAAVCGAEAQMITANKGELELRVSLQYDNYEAYAGRSLICNEAGYGQAILFGTPRWESLVCQLLQIYGSEEQLMTTDLWYDLLLSQVSNDEARYILAASPLEGSVNAEVFQYRTEIQEAPEQISQ